MTKYIIISPYSQKLPTNNRNPKNYPFWNELVEYLREDGYFIHQVGVEGEEKVPSANLLSTNLPFPQLHELLSAEECVTWISVDNFFPHFCNSVDPSKWGIVLWSKSNPRIFGYKQNINLYRDPKYFRANQFDVWHNEPYEEKAFVNAVGVISALRRKLHEIS